MDAVNCIGCVCAGCKKSPQNGNFYSCSYGACDLCNDVGEEKVVHRRTWCDKCEVKQEQEGGDFRL